MDLLEPIFIVVAGVFAGFLNVVAGGGSLITLPLLIFLGLPPTIANGTNRIAILAQNSFSVAKFNQKGVSSYPYSIYLGISALIGSTIGALLVVDIDEELFKRILSVVMVCVAALILFNSKAAEIAKGERMEFKNQMWGVISFFFIGIYGGFLHAGIGFIIILALTKINGFSLVKTNSIKVTVALVYTIAAVGVFIYKDAIDWKYALILAVGNSIGGYLGTVFSVNKGDKWIKRILLVTILVLAVKLWFY
ncbi:MAG: sulfite exporter TauE/SafE family protein [Labilibaculum sp.]|nr:sulfite exporter TauE/SafE family protein [Labilibaculum sp.]MBI9058119.1 sulfite exporter TauE/SafE family protein [Labilibaculum sp.]|eukprot:TRINITY_DN32062_c0_g2_i1.p1 TRINITY_DN32062_c0_g2~~TRINITY_DN32062_c0_g2_i1.p1  ORF type:complete len:250 (+),score=22.77 TRINITY_DN32062_c0_g2_i1:484-1233(+)